MDPLTHTLVGAALARTRLGRAAPLAGPALLVGASLPDIDVLGYLAGADAALGFRRGWTHGPLALLLLPLIWTAVLVGWGRLRGHPATRGGTLLALSGLACLTHPALDWLNTYGVRLLMPFDATWFHGDAVFIVDPYVWLLLGGGVFLARGRARVGPGWPLLAIATSATIVGGAARLPPATVPIWFAGLATIALVDRLCRSSRGRRALERIGHAAAPVAAAYVALLFVLSTAGEQHVRATLRDRGVDAVTQVMVGPTPANPLRWEVVVATPTAYRTGTLRWTPAPELSVESTPIPRPDANDPVVRAALAAPSIRGAVGWMRFPLVEIDADATGWTVHVIDLRYARSRRERFGVATVRLERGQFLQ